MLKIGFLKRALSRKCIWFYSLISAAFILFILFTQSGRSPSLTLSWNTTALTIPMLMEQQLKRVRRVDAVCGRASGAEGYELNKPLNFSNPRMFRSLFYDDVHRVIYCEVPKVACTNWKRILLILTGQVNVSRPEDIPSSEVHTTLEKAYLKRMDSLDEAGIRFRLDPDAQYMKFMFVRDPAERLVSAFRNKFQSSYGQYFQHRFGRKIIKKYRPNPSNESLQKGHDVTFSEFVKFIINSNKNNPLIAQANFNESAKTSERLKTGSNLTSGTVKSNLTNLSKLSVKLTAKVMTPSTIDRYKIPNGRLDEKKSNLEAPLVDSNLNSDAQLDYEMNEHWRPIYKLCRPCSIRYDLIGKLDSSKDDSRLILNRLNIDDVISFPSSYRSAGEATHLLTKQYYQTLSPNDLRQLKKIYGPDSLLYGYPYIPESSTNREKTTS